MTGRFEQSGAGTTDPDNRARITADVDRPDKILFGLTARQLAILAVPAVGLWALYVLVRHHLPLAVFAAMGAPLAVGALTLALGRRDGLGFDRLAVAALRHLTSPRRLVPAPDGVTPAPVWAGHDPAGPPAPLCLPPNGVGEGGVVDLGAEGAALVVEASTVGFGLRTGAEQHALVVAFGRYLNGLTAPLQVVVRAEPVDLGPRVTDLRARATGLPHPALEAAALAHAGFLADLGATCDLLARRVLVVFRDPAGGPDAGTRLRRRCAEAMGALAAAGVALSVLDAEPATAAIAGALDPWAPPRQPALSPPEAVVTGRLDVPPPGAATDAVHAPSPTATEERP